MPTGAPVKAPASKMTRAWRAVSRPSLATPVLSSKTLGGAGVVVRNSSVRVSTRDTGRLSATVNAAARGSRSTNLPPKPPPSGVATMRT